MQKALIQLAYAVVIEDGPNAKISEEEAARAIAKVIASESRPAADLLLKACRNGFGIARSGFGCGEVQYIMADEEFKRMFDKHFEEVEALDSFEDLDEWLVYNRRISLEDWVNSL